MLELPRERQDTMSSGKLACQKSSLEELARDGDELERLAEWLEDQGGTGWHGVGGCTGRRRGAGAVGEGEAADGRDDEGWEKHVC